MLIAKRFSPEELNSTAANNGVLYCERRQALQYRGLRKRDIVNVCIIVRVCTESVVVAL